MSNFTINSLTQGTLNDTDTFLKSDTNGALTKVTFSQLKNGATSGLDSDMEKYVTKKKYQTLTLSNLNGDGVIKRIGNEVEAEIIERNITSAETGEIAIATIPQGYRPTALQESSVGIVSQSGVVKALICRAAGSTLYAKSSTGSFAIGDTVVIIARWHTEDELPA